ncbi:N-acetyltransferase [Streptomyces johnsoniae]|uniref:N-acetyltransferase n=1 Tax=Streptomyces johnsoniae TaxID=3075532 RepID=A0ABU2SAC0_9ACTN|nr:N-acetyltransferase [Streptomyces sp. DSM 41886]MDT0445867.1 N-acetyltransferase [Streptomyces sp. DSM 41886]
MRVEISSLAERPDLEGLIWFPDTWPEFVKNDPAGNAYFGRIAEEFPAFTLAALDERGEVVGRGHSVPFALRVPGRGALPATGWDEVLRWAFTDRDHGARPDTVSAIDVTIRTDCLGQGLSGRLLDALRRNAAFLGFTELVAPVRPSAKHHEPDTPMAEYARRTRPDGLPADAWLRTHVRAGGVIDSVAPASMVVTGSLAQWREWTGAPFTAPGPTRVPGGLSPVRCVPDEGYAVYVEPNVWVRHRLAGLDTGVKV